MKIPNLLLVTTSEVALKKHLEFTSDYCMDTCHWCINTAGASSLADAKSLDNVQAVLLDEQEALDEEEETMLKALIQNHRVHWVWHQHGYDDTIKLLERYCSGNYLYRQEHGKSGTVANLFFSWQQCDERERQKLLSAFFANNQQGTVDEMVRLYLNTYEADDFIRLNEIISAQEELTLAEKLLLEYCKDFKRILSSQVNTIKGDKPYHFDRLIFLRRSLAEAFYQEF